MPSHSCRVFCGKKNMPTRTPLVCARGSLLTRCDPWIPQTAALRQLKYSVKARDASRGEADTLSPREALLEALSENGLPPDAVRFAAHSAAVPAPPDAVNPGDFSEDEETWEDILDESHDPWMRSPAPPEDALASAALLLPSDDLPGSPGSSGGEGDAFRGQPPSPGRGAEEGQGSPAAGDEVSSGRGRSGSGAGVSPYQATVLASMPWGEFWEGRGERGDGGTWTVLDVRRQPLIQGVDPRPPPGCVPLPLEQLSRFSVEALRSARFAVLMTDDLRGQQACVRLRNVYGYQDVLLLLDWEGV